MKGLRRLGDTRGASRGLVLGAGSVGLLAAAALISRGLDVDLHDPFVDASRVHTVAGFGARLVDTPGLRRYDIVVEASGGTYALETALDAAGAGSSVIVLGLPEDRSSFDISVGRLVMDNVRIVFSVNASRTDYEAAAGLLASLDPVALNSMISRELPLTRFAEALETKTDGIKTVVRIAL